MNKTTKHLTLSFVGLALVCGLSYFLSRPLHKKVNPDFDVEADLKNGKVQLIQFGIPLTPPDLMSAQKKVDSVTSLYGFNWDNRGCTPYDTAETREYNNAVIEYLSKRNGQGWWEKYNKTVDSLYSTANNNTIGKEETTCW